MPAASPPPAAGEAPAVFRRRPSRETPIASDAGVGTATTPSAAATPVATQAQAATRVATHAQAATTAATQAQAATPVATHAQAASLAATPAAHVAAAPVSSWPATEIRLPAEPASAQLMAELASLRSSLQRQLTSLSSTVAAGESMRRHPAQTRVMTRLLTAGFSVEVARRFALNAPQEADPRLEHSGTGPRLEHSGASAESVDRWLHEVLAHNLRCAGQEDSLVERRAVLALVGPTGVGKTTTVAKIAARFAVRHGPGALGLITLDAYRVTAHEQLRTYGRILGAPVHLAQDTATLRELLASLQNKRLVLIDTCGLGPRDERLPEMLAMLAQAGPGRRIETLLLLNAASHAETLDDSARAWRAAQAAGALLTKVDEAARIGGALDCALRHKLKLLGLTNGQRVPEDLHQPDARLLAHLALKPAQPMFELADDEGAALALATLAARGDAHA
jgi:flagellar biosynthesis protein FlhF